MLKNISLSTRFYDPILGVPLKSLRKAIATALPKDKNSRILDLCCGTGDQLLTLERAGYKNLHGLDLDPGMIAFAGQKSINIKFVEGDASRTPFPDASFDVIIISLALHDKDQELREAILKESVRLLDKNSSILVADFAFDKKTKFTGRLLITAVEGFAGGDHFYNFKDYTRRGGMLKILPNDMYKIQEVGRVLKGGIAVWELTF